MAALSSCGELATEVVVDVVYEGVKCKNTAAIAVGPVGEPGDRVASATSNVCDEESGSMGRLVVTPKADDGAEFAVEVRVRPDQGDPATCLESANYDGCIVARRIVSYIPGRSVTMRIDLRDPCVNTPCDQETTCIARGFDKACTTAKLDLAACDPPCDEGAVVEQSETGFSPCEEGFTTDPEDATKCVDVDECETEEATCDARATCENTAGGYTCACYTGYEGDGFTCTPSNCPGGCADNATCKRDGSSYACVCDNGFLADGAACQDIDECQAGTLNDCPGDSTCRNTDGSYACDCPDGYELGTAGCNDIDECSAGTFDCAGDSTCDNTDGSYECTCPDGYELAADGCDDIDECVEGLDTCPGDSTCQDTNGSYECTCPENYELTATGCAPNECIMGTDNCADTAVCTNTPGGFTCACPEGWIGDGLTCCDPNHNLAAASTGVTITATSTYGGYTLGAVIDGNTSTAQTEEMSWCNDWPGQTFPQIVLLTFPEPRTFARLELYTSDDFPIGDYDIESLDIATSTWIPQRVVAGNLAVHNTHVFTSPIWTNQLRVLARRGANQATYVRLNELQLFCQ